jgi:hypothetical protein
MRMKRLKNFLLLITVLLSSITYGSISDKVNQENCAAPVLDEPTLYAEEFSGFFTLESLKEKEAQIYESGMRLLKRAYINEGEVVLTHYSNNLVRLSDNFIESVVKHVEVAFEHGYIDALIFPDMGHSHLFVPMDYFQSQIVPMPVSEQAKSLEMMLNNPGTKFLYHTAEKLKFLGEDGKLLSNRHIQWRFYTRNLVGDNQGLGDMNLIYDHEQSANTARDYGPDYRYWGAGFNISISKNGCFAFKRNAQTMYFDLSLKDLPYRPSSWVN